MDNGMEEQSLAEMLGGMTNLHDRLSVIDQKVIRQLDLEKRRRLAAICAEVAVMCERGAKTMSKREAELLAAAETYLRNPTEENRLAARVMSKDIPNPHRRGDKRRHPWAAWAVDRAFDKADFGTILAIRCVISAVLVAENEGVDLTEADAFLMKAVAEL